MVIDSNPLVSVIIPFYNREDLTLISLESVLDQTLSDFEVILVNDGSTESINHIISISNPQIKVLHQENLGPAAARNLGMQHARGKYISFLDSDDVYMPNKLERQVEIHEDHPNIWLTHTSYQKIDWSGNLLEIVHSGLYNGNVFPEVFYHCPIATPTVMINRKVVESSIFYDEQYKIAEDIIFYSKIAQHSKILGIDISLSGIRVNKASHSANLTAQDAGVNNILRFVNTSQSGLSPQQKKHVNSKLFEVLSVIYLLEKFFKKFIFAFFQSFRYSTNIFRTFYFYIKFLAQYIFRHKSNI